MAQSAVSIEHRGPLSVAVVNGTKHQLDAFRNALLKEEFVLKAKSQHHMEFYRKARVLRDDWPMKLRVERHNHQIEIQCSMFIPWSWIAIFALLLLLFLPVASASGVPPLLFLGLGLAVIALAIVKQKFDLSPQAFWQSRPRQRWNDILNRLLVSAFG